MEKRERHREHDDLRRFILMVLFKEGPLGLNEMEQKIALQAFHFQMRSEKRGRRQTTPKELGGIEVACNKLISRNLLCLNKDTKYELTEEGKASAEHYVKMVENGADILETQFLSPAATARNTLVGYVFLAVMKVFSGLFFGSVGLIADGADTSVDTASAGVVWVGIKFKREMLGTVAVLVLMFGTAATLIYESATSILENVRGTFLPMSMPLIVIFVELIALLSAFIFSMYQRFVGRRSQSLALISQSVDSKNSVYSAAAVIVGAVFSIFGVYWVDAVVGGFIAVRITWDGIDLTRQAIASMRGNRPDFAKFKLPFEKQIEVRRMESFRNWILYAIQEENVRTRQEIIDSLERTFRPKYMPALFTEFTVGKLFDFNNNFNDLTKPLADDRLLLENEGKFALTEQGRAHLKTTLGNIQNKQK